MSDRQSITLQVSPELAAAYQAATPTDRRKLDLLLSLRLGEALQPGMPLVEMIDEASLVAQQNGLTSEALQAILHDE